MKVRECPFCKKEVHLEYPYMLQLKDGTYSFNHFCTHAPELAVTIIVHGDTPEQVAERWNGNVQEHSAE